MHKAKKSLGQNFLKSENILRKIVEAGEVGKKDIILEIGPGKGTLTEKLLEKAGAVIAIEKDNGLFKFLQEKFAEEIKEEKLILINDDILKFNIGGAVLAFSSADDAQQAGREKEQELRSEDSVGYGSSNFFSLRTAKPNSSLEKIEEDFANEAVLSFPNGDVAQQDILRTRARLRSYKIIANIPYNITGLILKKFLTTENQPESMVLMVQHEVAQRIIANDKKESILSISVKAYGKPKMIMKVDKRYFSPAPKVNSAIIKIRDINRKIFTENGINEEKFWEIVKKGFAHKRKKLSGNLKNIISSKKLFQMELKNKRAEDLSLEDWILLAKN